ncbi:hypothetical protein BP5796_00328 [Coleophoma crateriformis]|uniref:Uncharacterized protein n=1 Tax=Coleophoma crateriformis TaxID=565419 RepID=A0A3D8T7R6_9HELO|nr:hypothetical protein BP5796_00328 [Coleophoma crateriformis]
MQPRRPSDCSAPSTFAQHTGGKPSPLAPPHAILILGSASAALLRGSTSKAELRTGRTGRERAANGAFLFPSPSRRMGVVCRDAINTRQFNTSTLYADPTTILGHHRAVLERKWQPWSRLMTGCLDGPAGYLIKWPPEMSTLVAIKFEALQSKYSGQRIGATRDSTERLHRPTCPPKRKHYQYCHEALAVIDKPAPPIREATIQQWWTVRTVYDLVAMPLQPKTRMGRRKMHATHSGSPAQDTRTPGTLLSICIGFPKEQASFLEPAEDLMHETGTASPAAAASWGDKILILPSVHGRKPPPTEFEVKADMRNPVQRHVSDKVKVSRCPMPTLFRPRGLQRAAWKKQLFAKKPSASDAAPEAACRPTQGPYPLHSSGREEQSSRRPPPKLQGQPPTAPGGRNLQSQPRRRRSPKARPKSTLGGESNSSLTL